MQDQQLDALRILEKRILWLASWTIHNANHLRDKGDSDVKVGGHQASSASIATIMTALYFTSLKSEDRVAVKPHASPIFHAIQYLSGQQTLEKLENFRGFGGAQSYPSRTKDIDDVDFSTGSVGLGVAQTLFSSLVQDYVTHRGMMDDRPDGRMVALIGDAEMDEGNIYEALFEGWKHNLRNCWWIVDYNRQSLDAVVHEGLFQKFEDMFRSFGWDVVTLRHGQFQEQVFARSGGEALREWIEQCPNQLYSALIFQGASAWRERLNKDFCDNAEVLTILSELDDAALEKFMGNLGGHDLPSLAEAFEAASQHDRPTLFICYTIKGRGLPLAGHKDNHAGLMTPKQINVLRQQLGVREGHEWDKWEGVEAHQQNLESIIQNSAFFAKGTRRLTAPKVPLPDALPSPEGKGKPLSTQMAFGHIMNDIGKDDSALADRIVTTSPDVTVSTNLGGWVNRRGIFSRNKVKDTFRDQKIPSTFKWGSSPTGQHLELGIAESNLFILLSALGLSHTINGERLLPVGTVYDPFIYRAADQMNYACYQDARFMLVATPSGVSLAPEGGAHQSIGTPLVGMAQDRMAYFEPAFADELAVIMRFGFEFMQNEEPARNATANCLNDETGGSIYLRLSTRPIEQIERKMTPELRSDIIDGGYWLREPGPNAEVIIAYTGTLAPEAIQAVGMMGEDVRDIGLLAITSADRLLAGFSAAQKRRQNGDFGAQSHVERLFGTLNPGAAIVTVCDAHPATLAWLGSVNGNKSRSLGVEKFGQTGSIGELYGHYGIDAAGIMQAAQELALRRPLRFVRTV
ncbi:transketolase [Parasphingorhabdus halotolerans]|uniref:Pyruvate dehydrogenase E1 component n=1 Tax=Parasphingorhabdus halotolerans TaxID=2725558 RepID=A0A6H2DK45_9SPHN|nr:transketolase [Parasphingorhabdus halotolerans]QJB68714.1 transketolase [Parasphingorhabdus halotolerans]